MSSSGWRDIFPSCCVWRGSSTINVRQIFNTNLISIDKSDPSRRMFVFVIVIIYSWSSHLRPGEPRSARVLWSARKVNSKTIANFETELAKVEWENLADSDAETYFQSFFGTLSSKIDSSFPFQKSPPRKVKPDPPWFTQALKISSKAKNKLYKSKLKKVSKKRYRVFE